MATGTIKKSTALLWENSSPTSSFTGQTLSLDLSDYSHIMVEYALSVSELSAYNVVWLCRVGEGGFALTCYYANSAITEFVRYAITTTSGVQWWNSAKKEASNSYTTLTDGNYMIPLRIYGLKA